MGAPWKQSPESRCSTRLLLARSRLRMDAMRVAPPNGPASLMIPRSVSVLSGAKS